MADKKNIIFTIEMDDELLNLLLEQAKQGKRGDRGFKNEAYLSIARTMSLSRPGKVLTVSTVKNRCKNLKKSYIAVTELLNSSGFSFDKTTKRIIASSEVWTRWLEGHPDSWKWKNKRINYDKLRVVFGATTIAQTSRTSSNATHFSEGGSERGFPNDPYENINVRSYDKIKYISMGQNHAEASSSSDREMNKATLTTELVSSIRESSEALRTALLTAAEMISNPYKKLAEDVIQELLKISDITSLDLDIVHEWLITHKDQATIFLTAPDKREWLLRRLPKIRQYSTNEL